MSGHSKWKQIKHKKASTDNVRGKLFSKLANSISIAAREGDDPQFNSSLRKAMDQAKKQNMPLVNIERAIKRASDKTLVPMLVEVYGPGGVGILVDIITDSRNRTISELRSLFKTHDTKLADPGSLTWAFEKTSDGYSPKLPAIVSGNTTHTIDALLKDLNNRDDVVGVYTTIKHFG